MVPGDDSMPQESLPQSVKSSSGIRCKLLEVTGRVVLMALVRTKVLSYFFFKLNSSGKRLMRNWAVQLGIEELCLAARIGGAH